MNKQNLDFFLNENIQIDLTGFILSLICAAVLSFIIQITYVKFSTTLSNRVNFSKNFVILGVTTCIIIMIIKNSIALSLGLVGALSIVRFRAAIKEPEELTYLFLVIATGLGAGSGQLKIITTGVLFALLIIILYFQFFRNKDYDFSEIVNIAVVINDNINESQTNKIIADLSKISSEVTFVSMSKTSNETNMNFDIRPKKFSEIIKISEEIKKDYKDCKIVVARSNNLNL